MGEEEENGSGWRNRQAGSKASYGWGSKAAGSKRKRQGPHLQQLLGKHEAGRHGLWHDVHRHRGHHRLRGGAGAASCEMLIIEMVARKLKACRY